MQLFNGQTTDGVSDWHRIGDGSALFAIDGFVGGETVTIEYKPSWGDGAIGIPINGASYTEAVADVIDLLGPGQVRFKLAGAVGGTSINAEAGE